MSIPTDSQTAFFNPIYEYPSIPSTHLASERPLADNSDLSIDVLPKELLALIFSFLNFKACGSAQLVCRHWTTCINEPVVQAQVMKLRWPSLIIPKEYDKNVLKDLKNDCLGLGFFIEKEQLGFTRDKVGRILFGHSLIGTNFNQFFIYDLKLKTERSFKHNNFEAIFKMDLEKDILVAASRVEVKVWDVRTGNLLNSRKIERKDGICDVKLHNKLVYLCLNNSINSWDFQNEVYSPCCFSHELEAEKKPASYGKILFSKEYFFATTDNGSILIFNAKTKEYIQSLNGHKNAVTCLAAQDNILISGSEDMSVIVWDITTGTTHQKITQKGLIASVAIQGDLLLIGTFPKGFEIWSLKTGTCLLTKDVGAGVVGIQGDIVFASNLGNSTTIWDLKQELPYLY